MDLFLGVLKIIFCGFFFVSLSFCFVLFWGSQRIFCLIFLERFGFGDFFGGFVCLWGQGYFLFILVGFLSLLCFDFFFFF